MQRCLPQFCAGLSGGGETRNRAALTELRQEAAQGEEGEGEGEHGCW